MTLQERVKKIREDLSKSQKEMAHLVGVGLRTWQQYEEGVHDPSWKVVSKLSEIGYNTDWLASGKGPIKRQELDYTISNDLMAGDLFNSDELPEGFSANTPVDISISIEDLRFILLRDIIDVYFSKRPESLHTRASRDVVLIYRYFLEHFEPRFDSEKDKVRINEYIDEWF